MLTALRRWRAYVVARNELQALDAAALRDIGITPGHIHFLAVAEANRQYP